MRRSEGVAASSILRRAKVRGRTSWRCVESLLDGQNIRVQEPRHTVLYLCDHSAFLFLAIRGLSVRAIDTLPLFCTGRAFDLTLALALSLSSARFLSLGPLLDTSVYFARPRTRASAGLVCTASHWTGLDRAVKPLRSARCS
jgi:hypothetical protein